MARVVQRVVTVSQACGSYHNFFFEPGSSGSLAEHINAGWIVKVIKDNGRTATVVFERDK